VDREHLVQLASKAKALQINGVTVTRWCRYLSAYRPEGAAPLVVDEIAFDSYSNLNGVPDVFLRSAIYPSDA